MPYHNLNMLPKYVTNNISTFGLSLIIFGESHQHESLRLQLLPEQ